MSMRTVAACAIAAAFAITLGCFDATESRKQTPAPSPPAAKEPPRQREVFIAEGWVLNPHTEHLHTVVGFKTKDGKLLNLTFVGYHQQLVHNVYCRVTYHRLNDMNYVPGFLRDAKVDYFVLDDVELLPLPVGRERVVNEKRKEYTK